MESAARETARGVPIAVLLVDDEENVLKALRRLLLDEECEVFSATSGREGLEILKENRNVGVIISDQRMPEMTGVDFLERARRVAPYAMKIMLTGYADVHATADAINKGRAHRYMTKPWDDEELLEVVRSAVNTYRLIQNNREQEDADKEERKNHRESSLKLQELVEQQKEQLKEKDAKLKRLLLGSTSGSPPAFRKTLLPIVELLETREGVAGGHARFVASIATELCREMGLTPGELETVALASLLHDIGKISCPDSVLVKRPDEMSEEELIEYQLHSIRAQRTIDSIEGLNGVGVLVRHHHEAFDGSGFPDGLKGDRIPLGSRILAMSDYASRFVHFLKDEKETERLSSAVQSRLGKQFDPQLYPYLKNLLRDETSRRSLTLLRYVKELAPEDLADGMELAMDIRTETGILMLKRGMRMNPGSLKALEQYYQQKPANRAVFVYVQDDR